MGLVLWKQGQFAAAKEKFTAVLERNPQDQEASDMLGRSTRMEGAKANVPSPKERVKEHLRGNHVPPIEGGAEGEVELL